MAKGRGIFICAINGSAHVNGRTARRLRTILGQARARGARTHLIHLAKTKLAYCDGSETPRLRRDIAAVLRILLKADGIVLGTPTYWFNMSALMKNFIDRLTVTERGWTLEYKVAGFVVSGSLYEDGAMMAIASMAGALNHLGAVIFPFAMTYCRGKAKPAWATEYIESGEFARRMIEMITLVQARSEVPASFGRRRRAAMS